MTSRHSMITRNANTMYFLFVLFWQSLASTTCLPAISTFLWVLEISSPMMSRSSPCLSIISAVSLIIPLIVLKSRQNCINVLFFSSFITASSSQFTWGYSQMFICCWVEGLAMAGGWKGVVIFCLDYSGYEQLMTSWQCCTSSWCAWISSQEVLMSSLMRCSFLASCFLASFLTASSFLMESGSRQFSSILVMIPLSRVTSLSKKCLSFWISSSSLDSDSTPCFLVIRSFLSLMPLTMLMQSSCRVQNSRRAFMERGRVGILLLRPRTSIPKQEERGIHFNIQHAHAHLDISEAPTIHIQIQVRHQTSRISRWPIVIN